MATLDVNLIPVDENLTIYDDDHEIFDEFIDDPSFLFDREINFFVTINNITLSMENLRELSVHFSL